MRIALMSRWNTACGVSLHAELIGREWVRMGHELTVFAPNNIRPVAKDEEFVIRCYSDEGDHTRTFLNPEPFLERDYDVFVAQRLEWCPMDRFLEVFREIRRKAKTVYVVHERRPPDNKLFYKFDWDAVVCFDERYVRQWREVYGGRIEVIPYPAGPIRRGDKRRARKMLGIDEDEKVVFSYGWAPELHVNPIVPYLRDLGIRYLVLVDPNSVGKLNAEEFMDVRVGRPPMDRVYDYLHASDLCIIHKEWDEVKEGEVVISSSVLMCLGSLTPIMTSDTEFVSFLDREVIKYSSYDDLRRKVGMFFEGKLDVEGVIRAAEEYARRNSPERIAKIYLKLFSEL